MPKKLTIQEMQQIAKEREGKCLSKKYKNNLTKLLWQCKEGHKWKAAPINIKNGTWCPICSKGKLSIDEMRKIAKERGGKCLSRKYINTDTNLRWQCKRGHIWNAAPKDIKRGYWCQLCWYERLRSSKRMTIEDMHKTAEERGGLCLSKRYVDSKTKLKWQCREGHVWKARPNNVRSGQWCPICGTESAANFLKLSIEEMYQLAKERGGKCLSKRYKNSQTKLKWECSKGHTWNAAPGKIKFGQWCPVCGRENAAKLRRQSIEYMQQIAEKRSGKCLSKNYTNNKTKLKWKCIDGHTWWATPDSVKRGSWCPECAIDARRQAKKKKGKRGLKVLLPSDFK